MKKFLLTTALVAVTAISMAACDNKNDETAATEPASGESTVMTAPTDGATTTTTVTTETTTTPAEPVQGIAVGEPNPSTPDTQANTCGDHADLVGKNISDIDQASFGKPVRVLYPDSAATMDFNPERINIILDKDTDTVTEVRCG